MNKATYTVSGMTCEHCVRSVTEEVQEIPGVALAHVDLSTGRLTVEGEASPDSVRDAVEAAGYRLLPAT